MAIKAGRVAIVTGAAQGIGEGIAKRLAAEGAKVACVDLKEEAVKKVVDEINAAGGTAMYQVGDVGLKEDADRMVQAVADAWGTVDILVNNAGITRDAAFYKMTEKQFDDVIRINLKSVFLMTQACYWIMRNQQYGRIINFSSPAWRGNRGQANYAASKAGVIALTNVIAMENAKHHITCNAICPGFIDTPMLRAVPADILAGMAAAQPGGKPGTPDDIAEMVLFFAGEDSEYINGQMIFVDGARHTGMKTKG